MHHYAGFLQIWSFIASYTVKYFNTLYGIILLQSFKLENCASILFTKITMNRVCADSALNVLQLYKSHHTSVCNENNTSLRPHKINY